MASSFRLFDTAASAGASFTPPKTTVTVASVPADLVLGATLLGQPVSAISGTTITLAANANQTITSSTPVSITRAMPFYYSPHAEQVYASQPGRVSITWVTRVPNGLGNYELKVEDFAVSSNTTQPVRTIFWTEGPFDGPKVAVKDTRITTVSPVFYSSVPKAVPQEVNIPGYNSPAPILSTLSFDKFGGNGQIHAYNVEGRILIEYLGNVRLAGNIYESIGTDVVDIVRVPPVNNFTVNLGQEIRPHDGDGLLEASPVLSGLQTAAIYYGTSPRANGSLAYYAERETSAANNPDDGTPASQDAYNKVVFYWLTTGSFSIQWPKFQDRYWQRWSPYLGDYAHYTVDTAGNTADTRMAFTGGVLPTVVYQDDPAQSEVKIDTSTQRLNVAFRPGNDRNRSLLKFTSSAGPWYVNLYTQADTRTTTRAVTATSGTTVTVGSTVGLEVGMVVTGPGITGTATIQSITDLTHFVLSQSLGGTPTLAFTVEEDNQAPIVNAPATVGTRIDTPPGHEIAGYIAKGTGYYPAGYLDPFAVGVPAANKGAIIPVNALPTDNTLNIRWFRKIPALNAHFQDFYVPGKIGRYTVSYPASTNPLIIIAQGVGTDDLTGAEAEGSVYVQNNPAQPGFNPNEEHAFMLPPRAYALREDLNITSGTGYTSQPFVLIAYTDSTDDRPMMHAYKVLRTGTQHGIQWDFDYDSTAGTLLVPPYPLPLMPLPMVGAGAARTSKNVEIVGVDNPDNATVGGLDEYKGFTFKDRKGFTWVHRGPHNGGSPALTMKLYYPCKERFFLPNNLSNKGTVLASGTILPFLRAGGRSGQTLDITRIEVGQTDEPLPVIYRPVWPTDAAELRVGETLTLPKFGLPQVRGQKSALVLYQQSIANAPTASALTRNSVTLHDPTREKTIPIDAVGLEKLPAAIKTTAYQGKTYFQSLPPSLQQRVYLDPLRGPKGTLIFIGEFHDVLAGEDYLDLNLLTAAEEGVLKNLVPAGNADKSKWEAAIDALNTRVETFKPNPAQFGSYIVDSNKNRDVGKDSLAIITDSNTAVDSYAVTATGQGTGFVTMVFGNGNAFTPEGDPVSVQVFKIANQLYVGDLKVVASSNPLDEQVTLRHSGDFAGRPEDYEFDWRWTTGAASAPTTYTNLMTIRTAQTWRIVRDPGAVMPSPAQYTAAGPALELPRSENVHPVNYVLDEQFQPTDTVIAATSYTNGEIAAGYPSLVLKHVDPVDFTSGVPGSFVFSADLGELDGCVLYVNGKVALAYQAPTPRFTLTNASTGLTPAGLPRQFSIAPSYFTAGANTLEVAIYTTADPNTISSLDFMLEAAQETDLVDTAVTPGSVWQIPDDPTHKNTNTAIIGGNPINPFGGPQFVLNDRWFTMRYRPKASANNVLGTPWSRWMPPQFVEGWVKRVLAAINPFEQRVKDLYNNPINAAVSVVEQAGTRWEGDIALTMDNINDASLIAIYETVLNRARSMSIDANTNDPDSNNALTLAAGYLNDLYTILGNEAYADAANPTISIDDQSTVTQVNTSRFSFEGQVASSLDEELALLRGRDDFVSPGVRTAPAYNRLYWNYTHGINSGEVLYAVNYNIKEAVGSSTANGVIDEADAQRMFPQGHGDAYGHYLTALTGYYRLLASSNFTWTPRAEAVTVAGQAVTVDFQDERKFAAAAGNVARSAEQICALVYRQSYKDDPASGWGHYRDTRAANPQTGVTPRQGLDEWVSRSEQGALFNWAMANALVPDVDDVHTGVQKIDRTTVPEIAELAAAATIFQDTIDSANSHLNPLGLTPGAIAFDLSPALMQAGQSHFEQVYARTLRAVQNAAGAFNQAAKMTGSLRTQGNTLDDYRTVIASQETAYVNQLIDIYGRPYSGDIGPGKLYAQGYAGPDLDHWFIVDRPTDLVDTGKTVTVTLQEPEQLNDFTGIPLEDVVKNTSYNAYVLPKLNSKTVVIQPAQMVQYNDIWQPGGLGSRSVTGEIQAAFQDAQQTRLALSAADASAHKDLITMQQKLAVLNDLIASHKTSLIQTAAAAEKVDTLSKVQQGLTWVATNAEAVADTILKTGDAIAEFFPTVLGLANDATSGARGAAKNIAAVAAKISQITGIAAKIDAMVSGHDSGKATSELAGSLAELGFSQEAVQLAYEVNNTYREVVTHTAEIAQLALAHQRALQNVRNVVAKGDRVLAEREIFRQRAAAIIQGYRTKDLTFRIFRNEALEQYRSLFDLASRYTYLSAKSYDYETGLLGSAQGQTVFANVVAARSLGDVSEGNPLPTSSSLGDAGLAGVMAKLSADFAVVKGRLGINNPDPYGTVFSLRSELFRIRTDAATTSDDAAWRQTLELTIKPDLMADPDVVRYCNNIRKPDGSPVPGFIIPFGSTIQHGANFFGLPLAAGDHAYSPSSYSTKISSSGIVFKGYTGMDAYANGGGGPAGSGADALSSTPYVYLIPVGVDSMLAPPLGDTNTLRSWVVKDQALPLPYNLGATAFNTTQFFNANGTLSEQPWILRKHQAFRAVSDPNLFYSSVPAEFSNTRLIGRSVWNSQWKIVIPAYTLLSDEQDGMNRFAASVQDIMLFLRTYSNSGN